MTSKISSPVCREKQPEPQPVVIGALGGSGTRAVTHILHQAGWWMGEVVDKSTQDSLPMRTFLNKWFEPLLDFPDTPPRILQRASSHFRRAIAAHRRGIHSHMAPWGWKNPRNMWLIPFYASAYPQLKFIHVIRDGRDMSLSKNRFLLRTHGSRLLRTDTMRDLQHAQLELWAMGNLRAAAAARRTGIDYFQLRYEDLCGNPRDTVNALCEFLRVPRDLGDEVAAEVRPSPGIARWKSARNPVGDMHIGATAKSALETFGYKGD